MYIHLYENKYESSDGKYESSVTVSRSSLLKTGNRLRSSGSNFSTVCVQFSVCKYGQKRSAVSRASQSRRDMSQQIQCDSDGTATD